ncbi:hypothetical protein [Arthrobacter sp. NicSoilB8]|uniref:hypothetical protein n=1 Tax=Arthrobacter sp. NicSoilB8 TaxID=2830998 RepID=UPI001CC61549|nr:hypothetical protein [Arthrobacter sp. NicSoilB8]BCW73495.1 hypothetical protein NicSoilB8_45390 [Arthrobacter sp. NicSoilB8]
MTEPTGAAADAATSIFNLPDYRVISATVLENGRRQVIVETDQPPGCPLHLLGSRPPGTWSLDPV